MFWKCMLTPCQAPNVVLSGSTYYLYYAISSFGSQVSTIGVASSTSLATGTWTDHGSTGVTSKSGSNYNAIDPNLIVTSSATYLNFGSFWGDIYQVEMSSTTKKLSSSSATQISFTSVSPQAREGSFMFYNEDTGYYYLFWSEGTCCGYDTSKPASGKEYKIMM